MNIKIISASIRNGRKSHRVAMFVEKWLKENTEHEVKLLDLKKLNFPLFEERLSFLENPEPKIVQFGKDIESADAVFIVTPEYNGSLPASLKNVIDLLYKEWMKKPISLALVSGGIFAGTQVAKDLEFTLYKIGAHITNSRLHVGTIGETFNENGEPAEDKKEFYEKAMAKTLNELESFIAFDKK